VVTKCDTASADTGLADKLRATERRHVQLKLGFVGVRNRTQGESENGVADARAAERRFFEVSPLTRGLQRTLWGTDTLIDRIVELQTQKVDDFIRHTMTRLRKVDLPEAKKDLAVFPPALDTDIKRRQLLYAGVQRAVDAFRAEAEARGDTTDRELRVCARTNERRAAVGAIQVKHMKRLPRIWASTPNRSPAV
jgi:hypothetical protein